ncbi:MAG: SGNH/GDSL hydrolase family protein [Candidatus Lambdaproteobacteria bacterium]|nr:SGNH/GDSL hydrolase family protein [Candidatus Lambdaproteobacteria bacterium]
MSLSLSLPRLRRLARRLALILLWLVYLLVLIQLAGWIWFGLGIGRPIESYGYPVGLFAPHDKLDYFYTPHFQGHFNGGAYQDIPIRINGQGFRDDEFGPKSPGRKRLVVLGDSVVFGAGAREEQRFTELLQAEPPAGAAPLEVLNLGVNSYTFGHYLALAEAGFLGLAPDAVLVGFTLNDNDPRSRAWPAEKAGRGEQAAPGTEDRVRQWLSRLAGARLLRDVRTRLQFAVMNADEQEAYHTKWMRRVAASWQDAQTVARLRDELARFQALLLGQGRPFAVLLFPERNDVARPGAFNGARKAVLGLLEERGIAVCDPYDAFAAAPDAAALYLPQDSVHFSAAGHRLLGTLLAACIADGRVPLGPPAGR